MAISTATITRPKDITLDKVPVVTCITVYGLTSGSESLNTLPRVALLPVKRGLSYYSDATRKLPAVLAPRGWYCRAILYADGSVLLVVSARPTSLSGSFPDLRKIASPLVAFYFSSVCGSCIYAISCGAVSAVARIPGYPLCPQEASSRQHKQVVHITLSKKKEVTGETVLFSDPANVGGIGWPSGGRYSASGAVLYEAHRRTFFMQASIETCSVPASMTHLCAPITSSFVRQHWMLPP